MKKTAIVILYAFYSIGNIGAMNFQLKDVSFSPTFCYKGEGENILSKYLIVNNRIATLFSYDINTREVYVAEHFDKNGQCITMVDGEIDFLHSSGVYEVHHNTWVVISDFNFCGFYYSEWKKERRLQVLNSIKIINKSGIYYMYMLQMPEPVDYKALYTQKLLCYKNAEIEEYPDAFAEFHFYLNTPITYLIKNSYKLFFIRQLTKELERSKISRYYIQDEMYLP
jgi:hypothetical protein